ncbi:uncharacterized protein LOC107206496 isoform X3 [Parus major]|uniref:uncharacterized protein LOC107206496 isoform X3 n=1 Tax=Parus major TaxID=9157 RepID=UPI0014443ADA|nr:uncharacterized protein LOC107206496 isoform X3 [Parus major]
MGRDTFHQISCIQPGLGHLWGWRESLLLPALHGRPGLCNFICRLYLMLCAIIVLLEKEMLFRVWEIVFPVGQKTPESDWIMRKTKHSWAAFVGGGNKKGEKMAGENARILPKATHEERKKQDMKRKATLKTLAGKLLKTVVGGKEMVEKVGAEDVTGNLLKRPTSRKGVERGMPAEETICRFIEQGKFLEACEQIHNLEHSGKDGMKKSESLYVLLAEQMWTVVGEALGGSDRMLLEPLQSVGESLKWEKQKEAEWLGNGLETESVSTWSPNFWRKDLEEKLMQYMTAQIPLFGSSANTDETALNQHLNHLETIFLPSLEHRSDIFKEAGLLITYARCCHASLCSHLATLTDSNCFSFSQSLLIYEWSIKMYKSYEDEVRSFLQLDSCPKICNSLRVLENCCLLRTVWHKLTYICSVSTEQNIKVNSFLHRMEDDIMEHFLQTITSKVKGTLKDHFKKCDSGFDHMLESLNQSFLTFGKKKTDTYEALIKAVNAIIITEYMQALLTTPRKLSAMQRRRIVNKIEEDHRMMQTIFKECLGPEAGSLKDPIKAILELIQTSDAEGMKIALLPILKEFPDLRKEHLSAVLDIKDVLSREDKAALLKTFHDNCRESETEANLLFADIEVKPRKYGLCGCLCC